MRITGVSGQPQISQQTNVYTAQQGDTLSSIAAKLGVSESDLASSNNLVQGAEIKLGQQLNVPQAIQKSQMQQRIASRDAFETAKAPGTDLLAKGVIASVAPPEGDARGIIVQSEGESSSLNAAKLAEDIRFKSQFQSPQAAMGKPKSTFDKSAEVLFNFSTPPQNEDGDFFDAGEILNNHPEKIAATASSTKKTE